ncbi:MAG: SGNH/GDSL hydrolase family protein [Myxococcota bacterium]
MHKPSWKHLLMVVALNACGETTSPPASVSSEDAGGASATVDGGVIHTEERDAGDARDASEQERDAAVAWDASLVDAAVTERPDAAVRADAGTPDATQPSTDAGALPLAQRCFADIARDPSEPGPDYDQFNPVIGSHCNGTNHQDIQGVERVVFLGDSVTVGTPPTASGDYYRARLADMLAERFNLDAPSAAWKMSNPLSGVSGVMFSGDFASCAKWGARTDDLFRDNSQIADCFPTEERNKKTLVVFTIGGNDIAALTKDHAHSPYNEAYADVQEFVSLMRDAVTALKDPAQFPGGVYVMFGNMFEFTDGTGDVGSCPAASAAGFTEPWDHPEDLASLVIWANEQFLKMAVDTGSDMIFMLEHFCGHGFNNEDPENRCYRGPNTPRWFDLTCIHPNPDGHDQIANMFMSLVTE